MENNESTEKFNIDIIGKVCLKQDIKNIEEAEKTICNNIKNSKEK